MAPYSVQCRACGTRIKITTFASDDKAVRLFHSTTVVLCPMCQGGPAMGASFQRAPLTFPPKAGASKPRHRARA